MLDTVKTINGIDLKAVRDLVDKARDPACGCAGVRVSTDWKGQTRSETRIDSFTCAGAAVPRNFTIACDEPRELLGSDSAPSPQELLLSALNACMVIGYVAHAAARGVALNACRIETEGELDLRGFLGVDDSIPPGYRRISYTVHLEGDGSPDQYQEIHQAVMATSPNFFNLGQPVQMCGRLA